MKLLIVSATEPEVAPLFAQLQSRSNHTKTVGNRRILLFHNTDEIHFLTTGVGLALAMYHVAEAVICERFDVAIQIGIAGALDRSLPLGAVVRVSTEQFADIGIEEKNGGFINIFDAGFADANGFPFLNKQLINIYNMLFINDLQLVNSITVAKTSGTEATILALENRYPDAQIESMEGAAFFYVCLRNKLPFLQIRGISNYVEPRNRAAWNIPVAIKNVNVESAKIILALLQTEAME